MRLCCAATDDDSIVTVLYAGKLAGLDKKLSQSLDAEVQSGSSPLDLSKSPVGPLLESSRCVVGRQRHERVV